MEDVKFLSLLAKEFPNKQSVVTEIINLKAILSLPKGTEHFVSDLHGEYDAFQHVLRNGSGKIKNKISEVLGEELTAEEQRTLASLIYYPKEKLALKKAEWQTDEEAKTWYASNLKALVMLCQDISSKYSRSKVRKAIPKEFSYIIEELLFTPSKHKTQSGYYQSIIKNIIELEMADAFIRELCFLIQHLTVDHLHVVGDIYDRGPYPDKIINHLQKQSSVDVQWGNHDILWMGAAWGSAVCIANVIRIASRYNNLEVLEEGYGISLRNMVNFAEKTYHSANQQFLPRLAKEDNDVSDYEKQQMGKIQQAIAIIQFKLEGEIIKRRPEFEMENRLVLEKINYDDLTIELEGQRYFLDQASFPTIDPDEPYKLTDEEQELVDALVRVFTGSEKLQAHIDYLMQVGSMSLVYNGNLLYHGCVPMTEDGEFQSFEIDGQAYSGKGLFDRFEKVLRQAHTDKEVPSRYLDYVWYLWTGKYSPLFGKTKMTTFERYYILEKETHEEYKNSYYRLRETEEGCHAILKEFGLEPGHSHIINGHTPVKEKKGENPIKGNSAMIVIDGGYSKPYQSATGIAGYTLIYNSYGMELAVHEPFCGAELSVKSERDLVSTRRLVFKEDKRQYVAETDIGRALQKQIDDLLLLKTYYETKQLIERY